MYAARVKAFNVFSFQGQRFISNELEAVIVHGHIKW